MSRNGTIWSTIIATGSYIPERKVTNADFRGHEFYEETGQRFDRSTEEIIAKFESITGIRERRYVADDLVTSDIALFAARDALESSGVDAESLDYIVVAHNFGDVMPDNRRSDLVPTIAARVKQRLKIKNPNTVAYDLPFGCPGWLEAAIQADHFIRSGNVQRVLVIGAETLSRVCDPHDRDSMLYADGAGACVFEATKSETPIGIVAHHTRSDTLTHAQLLRMGPSYNPSFKGNDLFLKMQGHKLYEYALRTVPRVVQECMTRAGVSIRDVARVLIHQANAKMDDAILHRLYKLFGDDPPHSLVMPMTVSWLGNSSVATLPTLIDLVFKGKLQDHLLGSQQHVVLASVGAGMNINAVVYRVPLTPSSLPHVGRNPRPV